MGDDADRAAQPRRRGRVDRVLRRAQGPAGIDPGRRGPKRPCRPASCTWSATRCATRRRSTGPRSPGRCARSTRRPTVEAAEAELRRVRRASGASTYPAMITSWENAWDEFVPFLDFPPELRKVVYTTNAIESPQRPVPARRSATAATSPTSKPP
ncbi:MAG: transposase [Microthrixaceae bacterium]